MCWCIRVGIARYKIHPSYVPSSFADKTVIESSRFAYRCATANDEIVVAIDIGLVKVSSRHDGLFKLYMPEVVDKSSVFECISKTSTGVKTDVVATRIGFKSHDRKLVDRRLERQACRPTEIFG